MSEKPVTQTVDLYSDAHEWVSMTIPGSDRPVRLARLYVNPETKASVSLVEFPAGWRRPDTGRYAVSEEFVVLSGAIIVSGIRHAAGDYAFLPTGTVRVNSATPDGCRALAAFSGPPEWVPGETDERPVAGILHGPARQAIREVGLAFQGSLRCTEQTPDVSDAPMDLLGLNTGTWKLIPPGSSAPAVNEPTVVRWW